MAENFVSVGIGEARISVDGEEVLVAYGLGSCIGVAAYDAKVKVAGLLHVMLPDSQGDGNQPYKYADTGVPLLVQRLERMGAMRDRIVWKIAGGAGMFNSPSFKQSFAFNIGERNAKAVTEMLVRLGARLAAADTGGGVGRTMQLFVHDGTVMVRTMGQTAKQI